MNAMHRYLGLSCVLLLTFAALAGCSEPEEAPPAPDPDVIDTEVLGEVRSNPP